MLKEWDPETIKYSGRTIEAEITHLLKDIMGIAEGYAILSIKVIRK